MTALPEFYVKFWGVRGSIACPGPGTVRYGGNTTCIEICCGAETIIVDGGTGLRELGRELAARTPGRIDIFLTHAHWDHIAGIPFFAPCYMKRGEIHFWAGSMLPDRTLKGVLMNQMLAPLFPVPLSIFNGCHYHDFACGQTIEPRPGLRLRTCPLNHPNGACGYRVDFAGRSVCIITDTEHHIGERDRAIVDFVRGADIMVYDAMYTDEEYPRYVNWGHSTWQEAVRVGDAAGVGTVVPFHHDPSHDDDFMDGVAAAAQAMRPGTIIAREGMVLRP